MDYHPGNIHESLQKEFVVELNVDFNVPISTRLRFHELDFVDGVDECVPLNAGDILVVRWFRPYSAYGDSKLYTYIEKVNSKSIKAESTMSKEFVEVNIGRMKLFTDINLKYNRDNKINQIIK